MCYHMLLFHTTIAQLCASVFMRTYKCLHVSSHLLGNQGPVRNWPIKVTTAEERSVSGRATCTWHSSQAGNSHCRTKLEGSPGGDMQCSSSMFWTGCNDFTGHCSLSKVCVFQERTGCFSTRASMFMWKALYFYQIKTDDVNAFYKNHLYGNSNLVAQ